MNMIKYSAIGLLLGVAVIVFMSAGCSYVTVNPNDVTVPEQDQAEYLIWNITYDRTEAKPHIRWIMGDKLTCTSPITGRLGFSVNLITGSACREGYTVTPYQVSVAWDATTSFSGTALAHELEHAAQMFDGILDPFHRTAPFQPGGDVDRANARLTQEGL